MRHSAVLARETHERISRRVGQRHDRGDLKPLSLDLDLRVILILTCDHLKVNRLAVKLELAVDIDCHGTRLGAYILAVEPQLTELEIFHRLDRTLIRLHASVDRVEQYECRQGILRLRVPGGNPVKRDLNYIAGQLNSVKYFVLILAELGLLNL